METTSRDEILANFQAYTGIEDIGYCITILENHNWDLLSSVNTVIPQDYNNTPQTVEPVQETDGQRGREELVDLTVPSVEHVDLTKDDSINLNGYSLEPRPSGVKREIVTEISHEEDDDSEYDDARETLSDDEVITDDMFDSSDVAFSSTKEPLIPVDCEEPYDALSNFSARFISRYGDIHPLFYIGSLADAVKECNGNSVADRKPLFIYLHHDGSILSNIFCSQLLCCESIVDYLSRHYLVWAWDLTQENLKRKLLEMVRDSFGAPVANNVDDIKPDHLPVILIVFKSKGQMDVRNIIQGHTDPDTLLSNLIFANEQHQAIVELDLKEERERLAREEMKALQEAAFEESLKADREKERQRLVEENLKRQKEEEEKQELMRKEEERQRMIDSIPPEPLSTTDGVTTLRIRCPDGSVIQRRFLAVHTIAMLKNFVGSEGYHPSEYKVLTSFPRKDVTQLDSSLSLESAKLYPQETLFIEER